MNFELSTHVYERLQERNILLEELESLVKALNKFSYKWMEQRFTSPKSCEVVTRPIC